MKTKNQIAQKKYFCNFDECSPGEKATVTKLFDAQEQTTPTPTSRRPTVENVAPVAEAPKVEVGVTATIGRVGVNGSRTCLMKAGSTIRDLVNQGGFTLDDKKEGVAARSTGLAVLYTDLVVNNETYAITVGISSN